MYIYLHKILPFFVLPSGLVWMLIVGGLLFKRKGMIWAGLMLLWLCSTPLISDLLVRETEKWAIRSPAKDMPVANAIVVLSEGRVVAPGEAAISEWTDSDRFWGGVELYQAKKAPWLIFTGGWVPWQPHAKPEGEVLVAMAKKLGVPQESLLTTATIMNTAEEAIQVASLIAERSLGNTTGSGPKILLVTSAFHMPRAQHLFEHSGLTVIPFPVDFQVTAANTLNVLDFLPRASSFEKTELVWRELIGRWYYSVKLSPVFGTTSRNRE